MAPEITTFPNEKPEHPYTLGTRGGQVTGNFWSMFCGGCGYGIVFQLFNRVMLDASLNPMNYPVVLGIGCYTQGDTLVPAVQQRLTTLHGRAPAVATGIKLANPLLKPIIFTGDGDCYGIGGNHFIHTCRRNLDCILLVLNNSIYGMTGGQVAPTTPVGYKSMTTFERVFESRMDGIKIAIAAGATYVARITVAHPRTFMRYLKKAIAHKGTSVIEVVSPCVTYFGRKNVNEEGERMDSGALLMDWIKTHSIWTNQAKLLGDAELQDKYVIGEFKEDESVPEYAEEYEKIKQQASRGGPE